MFFNQMLLFLEDSLVSALFICLVTTKKYLIVFKTTSLFFRRYFEGAFIYLAEHECS